MLKSTLIASTLIASGLILTGCTGAPPATTPPSTPPGAAIADAPSAVATTGAPTSDDHNAAGLAAVRLAETELGGRAIDLDHDSNRWEVEVLVGDRVHEVHINQSGTSITERLVDKAADTETKRRAAAATVTLTDAVTTALDQTQGVLDDADLDDHRGAVVWAVTIDTPDRPDVNVHVDATAGTVAD